MNALFRILSREEYEKLNLEQKMVYLHALAADLEDEIELVSRAPAEDLSVQFDNL